MNTPNKLTLLRIILVLPLLASLGSLIFFYFDNSMSFDSNAIKISLAISLIIFILAMITDALDGYLARKNNQITTFGKLFDPIADKFMTTATLISLTVVGLVPFWVVILFVLRDILVDGSRNLAAANNISVAASIYGKLKTVFQTIAIVVVLLVPIFVKIDIYNFINPDWKVYLINIPMFIALFMSLVSGTLYFKQIKHIIKTK